MLAAGSLRYPITIAAPSTSQDSSGNNVTTFSPLLTTRASIKAVTGKDIYALGAGFTSTVTHKVTIRFPIVAIAAGMQVQYGGRTFLVQVASDPDELRVQLDLMCEEQTR